MPSVYVWFYQLGCWWQADPLKQHASPYLAMSNNPVLFTDPLGLWDNDVYGNEDEPYTAWRGIDENGRLLIGGTAGKIGFTLNHTNFNGNYSSEQVSEQEFNQYMLNLQFVMGKTVSVLGFNQDVLGADLSLIFNESAQINEGTNLYGPAGRFNAVFGTTASTIEGAGGSVRFTTSTQGISPKYYANSWKGNQYTKTYSKSKIGNALGIISFGLGVAMDIKGMMIYWNDPNNPNAVSPAEAGLNTGVGAYGLWVNLIGGALYFGVDAFYPGQWNGALQNNANLTQQNQAILGNGFNLYKDMRMVI